MLSRDPFAPREKDFYTFLVKNTVTSLTLLSARVKEYVMKLTLLGVHHWYNWLQLIFNFEITLRLKVWGGQSVTAYHLLFLGCLTVMCTNRVYKSNQNLMISRQLTSVWTTLIMISKLAMGPQNTLNDLIKSGDGGQMAYFLSQLKLLFLGPVTFSWVQGTSSVCPKLRNRLVHQKYLIIFMKVNIQKG